MKPYITSAGVAVGYTTPKFPSLTWHFSAMDAKAQYLYYTTDIWRFTVYWTLIIFAGFYLVSGVVAAIFQRRLVPGLMIVATYFIWGEIQAIVSGSIVGLLLATTYRTGSITMNTWIPFVWALAQIFYVVVSSYSLASFVR